MKKRIVSLVVLVAIFLPGWAGCGGEEPKPEPAPAAPAAGQEEPGPGTAGGGGDTPVLPGR